ncbi:glycine betaine transporter [Salsuginibacillus halophilus]|uniref:Glycine betaine transporter n=1 Tax=Salsuginibacillus halophilus TaxID=517424 RepID=A0A2P8HXW2_9BACI|nr:BCCT family transporter [Salsuginibacillus halophilus]PSL50985.1 glycine betaine transporter [Salsuginibacillus halophilus]
MPYRYRSDRPGIVFVLATIIILSVSIWGLFFPGNMEAVTSDMLTIFLDSFGWFYVLAVSFFLAFCLFLGFGPYRHMKLGKPKDEPEYSFYTWIGMLFAAGMGVGLVFWGVAEPMAHYVNPPPNVDVEGGTQAAAETGLLYGIFHWGMHPWSVYAIVALALAFAKYRKNLPGLVSSAFYPILKDRVAGPIGKGIDLLATVGTTVGIATSLGLSTLQVSGGLEEVAGIGNTTQLQLIIIGGVTVIFLISVVSGINRGMRYLSIVNLTLMAALLVAVVSFGPTLFIFEHFTKTFGDYVSSAVQLSFDTTPYSDNEWMGEWTFFYWAWIISWSPFVGTFIARVSRGRTLQQFMIGVLFVPTLVSVFWFAAFGGTGLHMELFQNLGQAEAVAEKPENGLFLVLQQLPLGLMLSIAALILILIFFITSANSATFVLGVFTSQGSLSPKTPVLITWGLLISTVAASLLLSGGLEGLQSTAIMTALPFTLLIVTMCIAVFMSLRSEGAEKHRVEPPKDW